VRPASPAALSPKHGLGAMKTVFVKCLDSRLPLFCGVPNSEVRRKMLVPRSRHPAPGHRSYLLRCFEVSGRCRGNGVEILDSMPSNLLSEGRIHANMDGQSIDCCRTAHF